MSHIIWFKVFSIINITCYIYVLHTIAYIYYDVITIIEMKLSVDYVENENTKQQ